MNLYLFFDWIPAHQLNMNLATSAPGTEQTFIFQHSEAAFVLTVSE